MKGEEEKEMDEKADMRKDSEIPVSEETMPLIEQIAERMPGGFFVYRADERAEILYVNKSILDIYGCSTVEEFRMHTGYTFKGMVHPDDLKAVEDSISMQIAESKKALDYVEFRIICQDGSIRWVDDYGHFVHTDDYGDIFYVFINDSTEKHMARELEWENHINQTKSNFLFNVSHDIRTPMNSIMGFTALAKRHIHEPELLEDYLNKVDTSNQHMMALIDDLLEMSQIESGLMRLKTDACSLKGQLETVLDMMRVHAEEKNILLEADIQLPDEQVLVDALRFQRIMTNLLSNAIKFTPEGGKITVSAIPKNVSKSGYARYVFQVVDNGIGIAEEFQSKIFQAFEREETSTKTGYLGTGLGLSITKSLVDIMGGSISVESKKGEGASFTVSLPLKLAGRTSISMEKKTEETAGTEYATGDKRILLVEDIEINRMLAEEVLKEFGYLVESVPDGCDAVEAVQNHPEWYYDLVLMDIQMPVMNGYEATRVIRSMGRRDSAKLPIIALSANARDEDKRMSMESGMDSHIAKPFDVEQLISTIKEHIQKVRSLKTADQDDSIEETVKL